MCEYHGQFLSYSSVLSAIFNNTEIEEGHSLCVGDIVVFRCEVTGSGILRWGIDPYVDIGQNSLNFLVELTVGVTVNGADGLYNATLTSISSSDPHQRFGNLTSELSVLIVPEQRIEVVCDDGVTGNQSIAVSPAGTVD